MSITLKQMAEELQLSLATVSMALRNSPLIASETRRKVNRYAAERGYIRNDVGVSLKMCRTRLIGFLLRGVVQSFYNEVLQGAGVMAAQLGYGLLLGWGAPVGESAAQLRMMLERNVDALIVAEPLDDTATALLSQFRDRGKPVVFCTGTAAAGYSMVRNDDFLGGRMAVKLLAERGHRTIAVSNQLPTRYEGNCAAAEEYGITLYPYQFAEDAFALVQQNKEITAVTAYSDDEAIKILHLLRTGGLRVPEDISVVGFDDMPICELPEFSLTTIAQQRNRLGAEAVQLAVRLATAGSSSAEEIVLEPRTVIRKTAGESRRRE